MTAFFGSLTLALVGTPAIASHSADDHSPNMVHVFNDKNGDEPSEAPTGGAINSDLAFWENLAIAGNYRGFRIWDITKPERPVRLTSFHCNGGQGDVSVYKAKERLLLIQSVDAPQNSRNCNSAGTPGGTDAAPGPADWEGVRIIDITNPKAPFFVTAVETKCGSHTHTTIPDDNDQRALVYVSSYPLGAAIGDECQIPHSRISIVEIPDANPAGAFVLKEQLIHAQPVAPGSPEALPGTIGCHDITAFLDPKTGKTLAAAACLTEGQLWDITDPANPCTLPTQETCHTHIDNPFVEIWHSSAMTWDGEIALFGDEHGGGSGPGCGGSGDPSGNIWFYRNQGPGAPAPLLGRYALPRAQVIEECTLHNFSVIPVNDNVRYIAVSSAYRGGTTVFDFTGAKTAQPITLPDPLNGFIPPVAPFANEIAWYDAKNGDGRGNDDAWSSYWYNNFIYVNGGLNRAPDASSSRGFDIYKVLLRKNMKHEYTVKSFHHFNPQTQEVWMTLGG